MKKKQKSCFYDNGNPIRREGGNPSTGTSAMSSTSTAFEFVPSANPTQPILAFTSEEQSEEDVMNTADTYRIPNAQRSSLVDALTTEGDQTEEEVMSSQDAFTIPSDVRERLSSDLSNLEELTSEEEVMASSDTYQIPEDVRSSLSGALELDPKEEEEGNGAFIIPASEKEALSDALSNEEEIGEGYIIPTDKKEEFADVFDISDDEIFRNEVDGKNESEPALPEPKKPEVDTKAAEESTAPFEKIRQDQSKMTTFQLGEVELSSDFDLFDAILDKENGKKPISSEPASPGALSEMELAEDFEWLDEALEAPVPPAPTGTPIILQINRVFEDEVSSLCTMTLSGASKVVQGFLLNDKTSGERINEGILHAGVQIPHSPENRWNQLKPLTLGDATSDTPALALEMLPGEKVKLVFAGANRHDAGQHFVLGDTLHIDTELKNTWSAIDPGVLGNYLSVQNGERLLEEALNTLEEIVLQDRKQGVTPVMTSVISNTPRATGLQLEEILKEARKLHIEDFEGTINALKQRNTPTFPQPTL